MKWGEKKEKKEKERKSGFFIKMKKKITFSIKNILENVINKK